MEDRALAQEINNDIINYINTFITNSKNKNAASQAFFLNKRLNEVKQSLQESEDEMEKFLEDNISFQDSPSLQKNLHENRKKDRNRYTNNYSAYNSNGG